MQVSQQEIYSVAEAYGYNAPKIQTWDRCSCDSKHRTTSKKVSCRLTKYEHNGQNATKTVVQVDESPGTHSSWAVTQKLYSGDYYNTFDGRTRNNGYYIYRVTLFEFQRDALNYYHRLVTETCYNCDGPNSHSSNGCSNVLPVVAEVVI